MWATPPGSHDEGTIYIETTGNTHIETLEQRPPVLETWMEMKLVSRQSFSFIEHTTPRYTFVPHYNSFIYVYFDVIFNYWVHIPLV